jgi:hypothetical protein
VDFPLLQRLSLPITVSSVRHPGIKIHDTRIIRLRKVLLHGGNTVGGWTAKQIHRTAPTANLKLPITRLTARSRKSLICQPPPDPIRMLKYSCLRSFA